MSEWVTDKGEQWSDSGPIKIKSLVCKNRNTSHLVCKPNSIVFGESDADAGVRLSTGAGRGIPPGRKEFLKDKKLSNKSTVHLARFWGWDGASSWLSTGVTHASVPSKTYKFVFNYQRSHDRDNSWLIMEFSFEVYMVFFHWSALKMTMHTSYLSRAPQAAPV